MLQWNQSLQQDWSLLDRNVKKKQECFSKYFQATTKRQLAVLTQQAFVLMKTYWRRLEDVFSVTIFCLSRRRRLENVLKTPCEDVLKASWRSLEDIFGRGLANTSWRRLGRWRIVTLKTSSRRLQEVLENKKCLLGTNCKGTTETNTHNFCLENKLTTDNYGRITIKHLKKLKHFL